MKRQAIYTLSLLVICSHFAIAQIGRLSLSPLQKVEQTIAKTDITVVYSRPSARGRTIFGALVPYGRYWRTGANRNTTITFSEPVSIAGKVVPKGKYALFSMPTKDKWEMLLYQDTDNWDVPDTLHKDRIIATTTVQSSQTKDFYENLTIVIENFTNYSFNLVLYWENTKVILPIDLNTREVMDDLIEDVLSGPDYEDYYSAATYEMESGYNFERGLNWINKAIELADPITWWDYRIKSILLLELDRKEEAKIVAMEGLKMAKEAKRNYGISEFEKILASLEE